MAKKGSLVKALEKQIKKNPNDNSPAKLKDADDELMDEIKRNLHLAVQAKSTWSEVAKEDIEFALGKQWEETDQASLRSQGRPVLTFNKIKPLISLVEGHAIQNGARIQVSPEGGEDETFSKVMDKAIDHIEKVTHLEYQLSLLRMSGLRAGRSWLEFFIDYDEDPIFGNLKVPFLGPFKIFVDPNSMEYDLSDATYLVKVVRTTKGKLKQNYPKMADEIDEIGQDQFNTTFGPFGEPLMEGGNNDYGNDPRKSDIGLNKNPVIGKDTGDMKKLTAIEYWYRKQVKKTFVYFSTGTLQRYDSKQEAEQDIAAKKAGNVIVRERSVNEMWLCVVVNDIKLEHGRSGLEPHYHGFPQFHFTAEWSPDALTEEYRVMGMVRGLKDPQREINKSRSQYLHILNTSANSGWMGDEDALSRQAKLDLDKYGARPGYAIWKKPGSQLERIHPVEPSLANQVREKAATDDIKACSGLNADLLSVDNNANPSGKAIALRIRQAITILEPMFQNFRYTKLLVGQFLFKLMPILFDAPKLSKVLGEQFMKENQLDMGKLQAFLAIIEDGKYNVSIAEQGSAKTLRDETLEDLMSLVKTGMQLPPDVIIDFMNIPNKKEVQDKIAAFQQQQMQAAQQAQQSEMQGKMQVEQMKAQSKGNGQPTRF